MEKTIQALRRGLESSSGKTPEFAAFVRTFKKEFMAGLTARGCKEFTFNTGHFYVSGFFTAPDGGTMYFNTGDVRSGMHTWLLYRTARDRKDYTGGPNRAATWEPDMLERLNLNA